MTSSAKTTKPSSKSPKSTPTLKFLYLYPNMMDLYGDSGNLKILQYRAEKRSFKVQIDKFSVGDSTPEQIYTSSLKVKSSSKTNQPFLKTAQPTRKTDQSTPSSHLKSLDLTSYDLIFLGGGPDSEQKLVARDIKKLRPALKKAYQNGTFFLAICGGYQLFGKYYKDAEENIIKGLNFFDFYTESSSDKRQRCIGNIVIETELLIHKTATQKVQLVGFENHGGQTHDIDQPFGRVLFGNGNTFENQFEGLMTENFIGTYLHGPLLSKNPELSDHILSYCLTRKLQTPIKLEKLDDHFELQARKEMLQKLLPNTHI